MILINRNAKRKKKEENHSIHNETMLSKNACIKIKIIIIILIIIIIIIIVIIIITTTIIIQTDHGIEPRRPDLVLIDKSEKHYQIIDVAIPEDSGVKEKENEECENLCRELRRMWEVITKVVPIVVGALGIVPLRLKGNLKGIDKSTCRYINYLKGARHAILGNFV